MITKTEYSKIRSYVTKDGSLIRELMHPDIHGNGRQSIAEAIVFPGSTTVFHRHHQTEEIYHILEGIGVLTIEDEQTEITDGDTVYISPGTRHKVQNIGDTPLKILCCCFPAYSDVDTELLE